MSLVSLTQIRKVLRNCQFNPREPGPMKVVADCGDKNYYMTRAIEMIHTSKDAGVGYDVAGGLRQAIGLLALALAEIESGQTQTKNKR